MNKKIYAFWITLFLVFALLTWALSGILLPFVLSFILAYILNPLVVKLESKGCSRTVASVLVIAGLIVAILLAFLIVMPVLESQVIGFIQKIPTYVGALWDKLQPLFDAVKNYASAEQIATVKETMSNQSISFFNKIGGMLLDLFSQGMVLFNIVTFIIITPVITFYLLNDWPVIVDKIRGLIPQKKLPFFQEQMQEIDTTLSAFVRGQAMVCLFLALFYGIGLTIIGLDLGFVVGFISGILSFIPYVGSLSGFFISLLLAFTQSAGWGVFIGILFVFGIGQFIEGYVLTPKLVGDKVGLHPAWVIFALFAGGYLFGFMGVLLAVPVTAVLGVILRTTIKAYKESAFYKGSK